MAQFGRYELVSKLGDGPRAVTWRARLPGVTTDVVLKLLHPHSAGDANFVQTFLDEARGVATLSHGNISRLLDFGHESDTCFLVRQLVNGQTLDALVHRAQQQGCPFIPTSIALHIAMKVCEGLHLAHTFTELHGALTPANVLIGYYGEVKLTDFAVARAEQYDSRKDISDVAAALYRMLCGQSPAGALPRSLNPKIPADVEAAIVKAISKEGDGFGTAQDLGAALKQALSKVDPAFSPSRLVRFIEWFFTAELTAEGRSVEPDEAFAAWLEPWLVKNAPLPPVALGDDAISTGPQVALGDAPLPTSGTQAPISEGKAPTGASLRPVVALGDDDPLSTSSERAPAPSSVAKAQTGASLRPVAALGDDDPLPTSSSAAPVEAAPVPTPVPVANAQTGASLRPVVALGDDDPLPTSVTAPPVEADPMPAPIPEGKAPTGGSLAPVPTAVPLAATKSPSAVGLGRAPSSPAIPVTGPMPVVPPTPAAKSDSSPAIPVTGPMPVVPLVPARRSASGLPALPPAASQTGASLRPASAVAPELEPEPLTAPSLRPAPAPRAAPTDPSVPVASSHTVPSLKSASAAPSAPVASSHTVPSLKSASAAPSAPVAPSHTVPSLKAAPVASSHTVPSLKAAPTPTVASLGPGVAEGAAPPVSTSETAVVLRPVTAKPRPPESPASQGATLRKWAALVAAIGFLGLAGLLFTLDSSGDSGGGAVAELSVTTNPPGAMVMLDGRPLPSRTPFVMKGVPTDRPHVLIIDLPGHTRWTQRLKMRPGNPTKVHAMLQPIEP